MPATSSGIIDLSADSPRQGEQGKCTRQLLPSTCAVLAVLTVELQGRVRAVLPRPVPRCSHDVRSCSTLNSASDWCRDGTPRRQTGGRHVNSQQEPPPTRTTGPSTVGGTGGPGWAPSLASRTPAHLHALCLCRAGPPLLLPHSAGVATACALAQQQVRLRLQSPAETPCCSCAAVGAMTKLSSLKPLCTALMVTRSLPALWLGCISCQCKPMMGTWLTLANGHQP